MNGSNSPELLKAETIQSTRQWFADNAFACIAEVRAGKVTVNEPETYFAWCEQRAADALAGKCDHTFAFRQRAHYIQTGISVPFMTDGTSENASEKPVQDADQSAENEAQKEAPQG